MIKKNAIKPLSILFEAATKPVEIKKKTVIIKLSKFRDENFLLILKITQIVKNEKI